MRRLLKQTGKGEFPWSSGHSFFLISHEIGFWRVSLAVKCTTYLQETEK